MHFGIFLKTAMQNCKVTQAELAAQSDVSQGAISRYLNGKASPKAEELLRISRALNVSMEQLLTGTSQSQTQSSGDGGWKERAMSAEQKLVALRELLGEIAKSLDGDCAEAAGAGVKI